MVVIIIIDNGNSFTVYYYDVIIYSILYNIIIGQISE